MIFGLSMGCAHKFGLLSDDIITLYRDCFADKINAVEFVISENEIEKFKLTDDNKEWLKSLKYLSFHLLTEISSYLKIHDWLRQNDIKINYFVKHPDEMSVPDNFKKLYESQIIYENLETAIFPCHNKICFDISHALKINSLHMEHFYKLNFSSIKQIHLSNTIKGQCHQLFHDDLSNNFSEIYLLKGITTIPIILENSCDNLDQLKNEVDFIYNNIYLMNYFF
jgi:hypothetical protein